MSDAYPKTADIVILGAGVMGASIAFHLAKRKAGKIAILDKDHVGRGGSGRSSALIRMHYSYPPEVQLALISLKMFEHWREIVGRTGRLSQNWICTHCSSQRDRAAESKCKYAARARCERPADHARRIEGT